MSGIVYEDFILGYEETVRQVLDYLNIHTENVSIAPPVLDRLADNVSEEWVHRFREERKMTGSTPHGSSAIRQEHARKRWDSEKS